MIKLKVSDNPYYYDCFHFYADDVIHSLEHIARLRIMGEQEYYEYIKNDSKALLKYSTPFVIAFLVNCIMLLLQALDNEKIMNAFLACYKIVLFILIGMLCAAVICKYIEIPSEKRSNKILLRAIQHMRDKEYEKGCYQSVEYSLVKDGKDNYIKIHSGNVMWLGHESKVKEIFGERKILVESFEYDTCQEYLQDVVKNRKKHIREWFEECEKNATKELIHNAENDYI